MLKQVLVPSKENSTISIPAEFYGREIEVVVYPVYSAAQEAEQENSNYFDKPLGLITRQLAGIIKADNDFNHKELLADALAEKYL